MPEQWTKADLINRIAKLRGYRSYLEICTAYTGHRYGEIDRDLLTTCHRMMYRCPAGHSDGMRVDFRSDELDTTECIRAISTRGRRYDIILVDPWHEYATSLRDLGEALNLITEDGTVVVHDCLPPAEAIAQPTFTEGDWCGLTYKAYLDFVVAQPTFEYRTVDIDYGCGVIRKRFAAIAPSEERSALVRGWDAIGDDYSAAFRFMRDHKVLWNVVAVEHFLGEEAAQANLRLAARTSARLSVRDQVASFFARRFR